MKKIAILGSSGSIGTQTLDIVRLYPDYFHIIALTVNKSLDTLQRQIEEFNPIAVAITDKNSFETFSKNNKDNNLNIFNDINELIESIDCDLVVSSLVGASGLKPTLKAIDKKIDIALANKETLVMAGSIVMKRAKDSGIQILPIDSEHSAIWQALRGNEEKTMHKILLTCSGGPFRGKDRDFLESVTLSDALDHPTWKMGGKITIDSATLMNKGLEVIEACHLFNINHKDIEVVVHPQSIIHSVVEYNDGNYIAQMGAPDMRIPIQYAMFYPNRKPNNFRRLNFTELSDLTFEKPDLKTFTPLALAYKCIEEGGVMPTILNATNEILVYAFLENKIKFIDILNTLETVIKQSNNILSPTIDDIINVDLETREKVTKDYLNNL